MDYLTLVKRLATETGAELSSKITSVLTVPPTSYGESTEHILRMTQWITQAWLEIQNDQPNWEFMIATEQVALLQGQTSYDIRQAVEDATGTDQYDGIRPFVANVDHRYIWVVDGSTSPLVKQPMYYVPPEHFYGDRDRYISEKGQPYWYSLQPDGCLSIEAAPPDNNWNIEFEYRLLPQTLGADSDTPTGLPDKFHMLIVYWAMVEYAGFDESDRQYKRAFKSYRRMLNKLRIEKTREFTMPGVR